MFRTLLTTSILASVLALGLPTGSAALAGSTQNPISQAGKATKDAGKTAVKGTKEGVKTTGKVTKDAAEKTATKTQNAGNTVKGAVTPDQVSAKCADSTVQTGKTSLDACAKHGGVKK